MASEQPGDVSAVPPSDLIAIAIAYNDSLDRCTQTGGANIDELMSLLSEDAVRVNSKGAYQVGKDAIRAEYLQRTARLEQTVELQSLDIWGNLVISRVKRTDTTLTQAGVEHHVRILLVKEGKIRRITIIEDPDEDKRLRS